MRGMPFGPGAYQGKPEKGGRALNAT